ncbi:MAG: InlB B-repeat-containing protein [Clostridia bacterium]|nr:InlB B-repeat-containing protein [Clostridia bacterium]
MTFVTFCDSGEFTLTVENGCSLDYFPNIARTGYHFAGWSLSETEPIIIDKDYVFHQNTTLYAFYEIDKNEYLDNMMVYDGSNSLERFFANGKRRILIENKNNLPITKISIIPIENSEIKNWYISATDEFGRDLINTSEDKKVIVFEKVTYGDVIIDFEVYEKGKAKIIVN